MKLCAKKRTRQNSNSQLCKRHWVYISPVVTLYDCTNSNFALCISLVTFHLATLFFCICVCVIWPIFLRTVICKFTRSNFFISMPVVSMNSSLCAPNNCRIAAENDLNTRSIKVRAWRQTIAQKVTMILIVTVIIVVIQ